MNHNITYISLGHRCHLASILKLNGQRKTSYPFDNIISKFEGVIDCIENNFQNFFPKNIVLEKIYVGKNVYEADDDGNRYLFRNKYFGFTHFNLLEKEIIEMFTRRIERFMNYLTTTNDKVIFLRTIMENDELNYHNNFVNAMYKLNPCLQYKIIYVYDNINIPEFICRKKDFIICNSAIKIDDVNLNTNPYMYKFLLEYLMNNNIFETFHNLNEFKDDIILQNDSYKGWAIKDGILPYNSSE